MVNPTTSREAISAMITMVKIFSPMGCLRVPESDRTLAARPRLESDSTPASASASLNSRPSPKSSPKRSEVTARAASSDMTTEMMAAAKYRPRMGHHEARNVDLVKPDDEEQHEYPDLQEELEVVSGLDQPGGGTEQHSGQREGDDRAQAEAAKSALQEFGHDDKEPIGSSTSSSTPSLPWGPHRESVTRVLR